MNIKPNLPKDKEDIIDKKIKELPEGYAQQIWKRVDTNKLTKIVMQRLLCKTCHRKLIKKPTRPLTDYCDKCRSILLDCEK